MMPAAAKLFPTIHHLNSIPGYSEALDARQKVDLVLEFEGAEIEKFVQAHPEYYASPFNLGLIRAWLSLYDGIYSAWNLAICYEDLRRDGLLEAAPPPTPAELDNSRGVIKVREDALMVYETPSDETAALEKLRDDSSLSDRARKNRDERLRLLAGQQRRALAPQNLYRD
jgi:hypothetical protein